MSRLLKRILGYSLTFTAILGVILTVLGIIGIWVYKNPITDRILASLDLTQGMLSTSADALVLTQEALDETVIAILSLEDAILASSKTISDTLPLLESLTTLVGTDLPNTIESTQASLYSAQVSARVIDDVLTTLASIPLMPDYNPGTPLAVSLGNIADSLDPLPGTLQGMETSLIKSQGNILLLRAEFSIIARHVSNINQSIYDAKNVVGQYQQILDDLFQQVTYYQDRAPGWINTFAFISTLILVWLLLINIGVLIQGMELAEFIQPQASIRQELSQRDVVEKDANL